MNNWILIILVCFSVTCVGCRSRSFSDTAAIGQSTRSVALIVDYNDDSNRFGNSLQGIREITTSQEGAFRVHSDRVAELSGNEVSVDSISDSLVGLLEPFDDNHLNAFLMIGSHGESGELCHSELPNLRYEEIFSRLAHKLVEADRAQSVTLNVFLDSCYSASAARAMRSAFAAEDGEYEAGGRRFFVRANLYYGSSGKTKYKVFWNTIEEIGKLGGTYLSESGGFTELGEKVFCSFEYLDERNSATSSNLHGVWSSYRPVDCEFANKELLWEQLLFLAEGGVPGDMLTSGVLRASARRGIDDGGFSDNRMAHVREFLQRTLGSQDFHFSPFLVQALLKIDEDDKDFQMMVLDFFIEHRSTRLNRLIPAKEVYLGRLLDAYANFSSVDEKESLWRFIGGLDKYLPGFRYVEANPERLSERLAILEKIVQDIEDSDFEFNRFSGGLRNIQNIIERVRLALAEDG